MAEPIRRVLAIEPYAAGSHRSFLEGLTRWSRHEWVVSTLPPRKWKWRLRTSALHFAREVVSGGPWDLLFVSDYLNLAELVALLPPPLRDIPAIVYFHENQLTYPLQDGERRDVHFGLNHLYAMLAARSVAFNSAFHQREFARALEALLALVPDVATRPWLDAALAKAVVQPLGHELEARPPRGACDRPPIIAWNHRWEYDKDPAAFLAALRELDARGLDFRIRLLGQRFETVPPEFDEITLQFAHRLDHVGFVADRGEYFEQLAGADIVVSTANHDFFGLGTLEALRLGLYPVLPDDLAYPELLPDRADVREAFLYPRAVGLAEPLARALRHVRDGELLELRESVVRHTDEFHWSRLAPRYDALIAAAIASRHSGPAEAASSRG
ncbi:MAG: DUF3524 domain-containing protein [Planctomycetota bacterium]